MRTKLIVLLSAGLLAGGVVAPVSASAEPMPTKGFASCKKLRAEYPNGIAKNKKSARKIVKRGYERPIVCRRVYKQVKRKLDRNRNGVACETR